MAIAKNGSTATTSFTTGATSFTTGNFTVAGALSNSVLVVKVTIRDLETVLTDPEVTSVKWGGSGGTPLTKAISKYYDKMETSIWYLVAPTAQTATIYVATAATANVGCCISAEVWTGVLQASTIRNTGIGFVDGAGTTVTCDVSSATDDLVLDSAIFADSGNITRTVGANQTEDAQQRTAYAYEFRSAASNEAGAATVTMSWSWTGGTAAAICAAAFKPYVSAETHINIALAVGGS